MRPLLTASEAVMEASEAVEFSSTKLRLLGSKRFATVKAVGSKQAKAAFIMKR
jgi:hypothetical protein